MKRSAFTVLELIAAAILAAALLGITFSYLTAATSARRSIRQRTVAVEEANNVMATVFAWPYEAITQANVAELQLSEAVDVELSNGALVIDVAAAAEQDLESKRITVEVKWRDRAGVAVKPVRLTAWRYNVLQGTNR